jgi:hypothetical protein
MQETQRWWKMKTRPELKKIADEYATGLVKIIRDNNPAVIKDGIEDEELVDSMVESAFVCLDEGLIFKNVQDRTVKVYRDENDRYFNDVDPKYHVDRDMMFKRLVRSLLENSDITEDELDDLRAKTA